MTALITPIPPDGLASPAEVAAALAALFLDELSMAVDVNPTETEPLPQQAPKYWAERKSAETTAAQTYWWLTWRGHTPGLRTFGTPEYTRTQVEAWELAGALPVNETTAHAPEWGTAVRDAMNVLEAN